MKIVAISDTHGKHEQLVLPHGDILVHAGDISMKGTENEIESFLLWFKAQNYTYKIFIAGNHDFFFERHSENEIQKFIPPDVIYLNDSGIEIAGLKFWGSPITPWFMNWAFNRRRAYEIVRYWDLIPTDTDVLITHGPMFGRLDENKDGEHVGCKDLLLKSEELKIKAHIFGHIHESYGSLESGNIQFLNASVLNERYELVNAPFIMEF